MFLAANYVRPDRVDDAEREIGQVTAQRPGTTIFFEEPEQLQALLENLR